MLTLRDGKVVMKARIPGSYMVVLCAQKAARAQAAGSMAAAWAHKAKKENTAGLWNQSRCGDGEQCGTARVSRVCTKLTQVKSSGSSSGALPPSAGSGSQLSGGLPCRG